MTGTPTIEHVHNAVDVQHAVCDAHKVLPVGSRTKPALSHTAADVLPLDMRGLSGIEEYEPAEYTITALAGTPVADLERALLANGQYLPFDPVFVEAGATVGGSIAAGLSGSGRLRYGGVRDFILGARFVDGQGRLIRGGGKVVKNAAGFDFPKLLVGSLGRLGIMVDATFKVFPRPPAYATLFTEAPDVEAALATVKALSVSPIDLFAMDIEVNPDNGGCTLATRIGGVEDLLADRADRVRKMMPASEIVEGGAAPTYWSSVGEFSWAGAAASLIKIPLTPARIPEIDRALARSQTARRYAVAGNVLWAAWTDSVDALDDLLADQGLTGVVLRGESSRPLIGAYASSVFADRVAAALDPNSKFPPLHQV